jgi:hypothetical protein
MSSPLTDAVISSMASSLNPENARVAEFMSETTAKLSVDTQVLKAEAITNVAKLYAQAKSNQDTPASVLDAYDRILAKLSS